MLIENFMFPRHSQHATVRELVAGGVIGTPRTLTADFAFPSTGDDNDIRYQPDMGAAR
ncbi:hypothetical protein [Amycolatopsis panacis]|uniref:hypothetical protein n=1 Tax=Amycolatopsis panacis TaxID=2340917 RepID=UPI001314884E|nr:hypothetical protein [Amycolatopsis panacis]